MLLHSFFLQEKKEIGQCIETTHPYLGAETNQDLCRQQLFPFLLNDPRLLSLQPRNVVGNE
jgi:hypothetical protein